MQTITTKQIRQDLQGFLRRLQQGEQFTITHRSQPLVSIGTLPSEPTPSKAIPGSPQAIQESLSLAQKLRASVKQKIDTQKSTKELYTEFMEAEHDFA